MRFSDIKIGHIYNVIFDPVKTCEFNGKHLAVVLKRNNDKQTFIVMPLTSESNGDGVNKIKIGGINSLPSSLKNNETYAVFNQIRTVNANRFIALKEGSISIQAKLEDDIVMKLLSLGINEILFNLEQEKKLKLLKDMYQQECVIKARNLAYNIIKLQKENKELEIKSIKSEIRDILTGIEYVLEQKYIDEGVQDIFDSSFKTS